MSNLNLDINTLSDEEIESYLLDDNIDFETKNSIIKNFSARMKQCSFEVFKEALSYIETPEDMSIYQDRIESLTYQELVDLVYNGGLNEECLLEVMNYPFFQKLLDEEKYGTKTFLQSFMLLARLYRSDSVDTFLEIGYDIQGLIEHNGLSSDIEVLIDSYVIELLNQDVYEDKLNSICLNFINYYFQNHKFLSKNLMQVYLKMRIKELNLNACQDIVIENEELNRFGDFQGSTGTLTINRDYIIKKFTPYLKDNQVSLEETEDFFNMMWLYMSSHELCHIIRMDELNKTEASDLRGTIMNNVSLYYYFENGLLRIKLGEDFYKKNHHSFIEEIRADNFACFDSIKQINDKFKGAFNREKINSFFAMNVAKVLKNYSDGSTPMQKFEALFKEHLPDEEFESKTNLLEGSIDVEDVINNLLMGDYVPECIIGALGEIARGELEGEDIVQIIQERLDKRKVL